VSTAREVSFEFFPPRTPAGRDKLRNTWRQLAELKPRFFSVTFGAGGSTREGTLDTVLAIRAEGHEAAPHLSCVASTRAEIAGQLERYRERGIRHLVALRGDVPSGIASSGEFRHADELVAFIRETTGDWFTIDVACYPEFHPQTRKADDEIRNFKKKVDAGANAAITQYFYNADAYWHFVDSCAVAGIDVPIRHAACSAATLLFGRTHLDLVRVGISLYGLWPSRETYVSLLERGKPTIELRPALCWKTRVAQVKTVPEGSYVGYGCTYRATRRSQIAVLPVGYHEGYDRGLSGVAHVLLRGRRAPVRGRVCMNLTMVDVTDVPEVELEDEVTLLGRQGGQRVTADDLAGWIGTISYEVVARIRPGLPRILVE